MLGTVDIILHSFVVLLHAARHPLADRRGSCRRRRHDPRHALFRADPSLIIVNSLFLLALGLASLAAWASSFGVIEPAPGAGRWSNGPGRLHGLLVCSRLHGEAASSAPRSEVERVSREREEESTMNIMRLFACFSGRIPRISYWLGLAAVVLVFGLGRYGLKQWLGMDTPSPDDLAVTLWTLLAMVPLTALIVKRFNDRDRPAWIGYAVGAVAAIRRSPPPTSAFSRTRASYTLDGACRLLEHAAAQRVRLGRQRFPARHARPQPIRPRAGRADCIGCPTRGYAAPPLRPSSARRSRRPRSPSPSSTASLSAPRPRPGAPISHRVRE